MTDGLCLCTVFFTVVLGHYLQQRVGMRQVAMASYGCVHLMAMASHGCWLWWCSAKCCICTNFNDGCRLRLSAVMRQLNCWLQRQVSGSPWLR